MNKPSGSFKQD